MSELPVVVIGAGPLGLAAAAHLLERGLTPLVLEAGTSPASAIEQWEHVRTFSPWPELIDPAAARLLEPTRWTAAESGFPTGREWIDRYLAPVAAALGTRVRYGARVGAVSRLGRDRLVSPGRAETPFVVHVTNADGTECRVQARAVIDASGTWGQPNPAGADGVPAIGERAAAASGVLSYVPPTLAQASGLAGKRVVVVGSGHSAMTAVIQLGEVVRKDPSTTVTWVLRRGVSEDTFGGGAADELPQRGALGVRSKEAVEAGRVSLSTGFRTERIDVVDGRAVVTAEDGRALPAADHVMVLTGFRPDLSFLSEMRIELDPILQAPVNLAPSIDPNMHSCGSVLPHGAAELAHPEPNLYIVGMKSYGRAPTFLAMTGYEQVRSIAAELAGDHAAARRVELTLPDTGVCNGAGLFDSPEGENAGGGVLRSGPGIAAVDAAAVVVVPQPHWRMTQTDPPEAPSAVHGLRWVLLTLCITEITSWGVLYYAFTVLSEQISADTGWSAPAVTAAFSAGLVTSAAVGIPVGRWLDRVGPRWIMTAGSMLGAVSVVAVVAAPNYGWFVAAWVMAGVAMSAVFYAPAFAALTRFFGTDAVRALTVLTLVAGFASTVFAPLTAALSAQMSWRHTYLVLAAVMASITIPAHFFGLRRPWPPVTKHHHVEAPTRTARSGPFLALVAAFALAGLASYAVIANLVPLMSQRGISTGAAAVALGLGGAGQVLGRLGYQTLVRRVGVVPRTVIIMAGVAVATALLGLFTAYAALVAVAIGAGVMRGIMTLLQATAVTERWGATHYGHLSAYLNAPVMIATAVGPFIGAALASLLGGYAVMFIALGAIAGAGALVAAATKPRVETPAPIVRV